MLRKSVENRSMLLHPSNPLTPCNARYFIFSYLSYVLSNFAGEWVSSIVCYGDARAGSQGQYFAVLSVWSPVSDGLACRQVRR